MAEKHCAFGCGVPMDMSLTALVRWEYIGWAKKRARGPKSGGLHALELPEQTGAVAHASCVEKAKKGIHPNQMTLG